ncbi:hypothetical protein PsorP6_003652 [Peronosclerospora sorghi]|uniref:Uncharacterized protein n=1 Tax=Peronosclerospora sorghi TaxID=230839 RepID=A0ACC0VS63_9STRA|nr:hypothetical protein PsorP6_003652 [Peronosclerospora sorghi]
MPVFLADPVCAACCNSKAFLCRCDLSSIQILYNCNININTLSLGPISAKNLVLLPSCPRPYLSQKTVALLPSPYCMKNSTSDDDIDMSVTCLRQVEAAVESNQEATPTLQIDAIRHQLANADDVAAATVLVAQPTAASKNSLAFILADEDQALKTEASLAFAANIMVESSVSAAKNNATNVPTAAEAKSTMKKSRICKSENCTRYVVNRGLCIGHGVSSTFVPFCRRSKIFCCKL